MWALSKQNSLDLQTFQNQNTSFIYEQNGRRWRESCHPLSIEIVQYNARIKNATRCNFECFHLLLAPATFLITHPYYYFVLFLLFAFILESCTNIEISFYMWRALLVPLVINILAATAQAVSNTHTHTHKHSRPHGHMKRRNSNRSRRWKNNQK